MINNKLIGDWATPKPASERTSLSPNFSGYGMKGRNSKSGLNIGEGKGTATRKSKENVIDTSIHMPLSNYGEKHMVEFSPQSSVHLKSKGDMSRIGKSAAFSSSPEILWATMKPHVFEKTVPFGSRIIDKAATLSGGGKEEKDRNPYYGKTSKAIDSIAERKPSYDVYGIDIMKRNSNRKTGKHSGYDDSRFASISDVQPVIESKRQLYHSHDTLYGGTNNDTPASMTAVQYDIGFKQYTSAEPTSHVSLTHVNAVESASRLTPVSSRDTINSEPSNKWDQVISAKDSLIKKKDHVIERQKQTIEQLQSHIMVIEDRISQSSTRLNEQQKDDEKWRQKLNDSEHQISTMKAQLQHVSATKQDEVEKLQKKLGETEYELQKLEKGFKDVGREQTKEISELKQKIAERDQIDGSLKSSLETLQEALKEERRKAHSLKQYLQDLPTLEEYSKLLQQVKDVKFEKSLLEEKIDYLEQRLKEAKCQTAQKDLHLDEEKQSKEEVIKEFRKLTEQIDRYKERDKDGPVTLEEFDEVKWENERVKADCERLKKLIEQKHKKMKVLHQQNQSTVKALEERLAQEENTVNVLRKEIESKDVSISDLKTSYKQIQDSNQDLMRDNIALKDILSELERLTSAEVQEAHHQVHKELSLCVSEINYLIDLCSEIAEGKDPNMSTLLGIKGHSEVETNLDLPSNPFSAAAAKARLSKIRELRSEVDKLRSFVSDKYAEDVGNNCITQ